MQDFTLLIPKANHTPHLPSLCWGQLTPYFLGSRSPRCGAPGPVAVLGFCRHRQISPRAPRVPCRRLGGTNRVPGHRALPTRPRALPPVMGPPGGLQGPGAGGGHFVEAGPRQLVTARFICLHTHGFRSGFCPRAVRGGIQGLSSPGCGI